MRRFSLFALVLALAGLALPAYSAQKVERRCGWFENPTPANVTLTDRDGTWEIATQGGYQANGDWPQFKPDQWVRTNRNYGYGCGCMTATADSGINRLDNLTKAVARPLAACRSDPALTEPEHPLASMSSAQSVSRKDMVTYRAEGFSFKHPKGWKVSRDNECLRLDEPNLPSDQEYTLKLCVRHGTLEQAADSLAFSLENGVWNRTGGKDSPSPADIFEGPEWSGMQTTQTCGVVDEDNRFDSRGGTCLMAVIYNASTQLLFDTAGHYQDFDTVDAVIRSVRFDEKK
ncbi:DUF4087 domain-containing protein [Pseudomonas viridiflava]|uniref:DUF4087 domain-containing protein n=1 Tax=Pseudomonas viridiflava TaxID=33069 RepID=UPI000F044EB0|nr:DUF4087 domain-containing protein [Pseudomonas viridiflava]